MNAHQNLFPDNPTQGNLADGEIRDNGASTDGTHRDLTAAAFNQLLDWLDRDRETAARRYEQIRSRLITIFECRGCPVAEELADTTIDRVATKISQITADYVGDPEKYFYGVAGKIYLEYVRKRPVPEPAPPPILTEEIELKYRCLEQCMEGLREENRELILFYYGQDGRQKINQRKALAVRLGLAANALSMRAHRIRESLGKCVSDCFHRWQSGQSTLEGGK
jgi:DNA-directed RNA polymerase specialized sigma24 family protein